MCNLHPYSKESKKKKQEHRKLKVLLCAAKAKSMAAEHLWELAGANWGRAPASWEREQFLMWDFSLLILHNIVSSSWKETWASSFNYMSFRKQCTCSVLGSQNVPLTEMELYQNKDMNHNNKNYFFFSELLSKIKALCLIHLPFYVCFLHFPYLVAKHTHTLQQNNPYSYLRVPYVIWSSDNMTVIWSEKCWINYLSW